jgi:hypothetical protein
MRRGRRSIVVAVMAGALAVPAAASAAPSVVASAAPGVPQDCQAGCIQSIRVSCTAADALSVRTTVRCWTNATNVWSSWQNLPAATVTVSTYSPRTFTLCAEGIATYADGSTASSGVHCAPSEDVGVAFVAG